MLAEFGTSVFFLEERITHYSNKMFFYFHLSKDVDCEIGCADILDLTVF